MTVALYIAMILLTRPLELGDTIFYVDPILAMSRRPDMANLRLLLDFGHVLWRPLGWLIYEGVHALAPITVVGSERVVVIRVLIGISMIAGAAGTALLYAICRQLRIGQVSSIIACMTFIGCNAVVNIAQAGTSYMLSLALLMGALWLALLSPSKGAAASIGSGALLALSAAIWFPFVLMAPAVALASVAPWDEAEPRRARRVIQPEFLFLVAAAVATGVLVFGAAALTLHIQNADQFRAWMQDSGHGWRQRSNLLRLAIGLPRCCVALGDAGLLWKRFILHDPFSPVTRAGLIRNSVWSISLMAAFYVGLASLVYSLARRPRGRVVLGLLVIAAIPALVFAVFLFEPSSIERFTPVFPFLFLALGYQIDSTWQNAKMRTVALLFPTAVLVSTIVTYRNASVSRSWAPAIGRLTMLKQHVPPGSTVALLTNQDVIYSFARNNALRDTLSTSFEFWVVLRPANNLMFCWREGFAKRAIEAWNASHEVWISQRLVAAAPRPEWGWAEGDDTTVRWLMLPQFFGEFQRDEATDGDDGFVRLPNSTANRALLQGLASDSCRH